MPQEYTLDVHVARLKKMLGMKNIPTKCPAAKRYNHGEPPHAKWEIGHDSPCDICLAFVKCEQWCPCPTLGEEEAIKRTTIAIKEYEDKKFSKKGNISHG